MAIEFDLAFTYNEKETVINDLVEDLDKLGYSKFFWRRDLPVGTPLAQERERLDQADKIIVCLGTRGWGPNHLKLVKQLQEDGKKLYPVVIGDLSEADKNEADNLFLDNRYMEVYPVNATNVARLVHSLGRRNGCRLCQGFRLKVLEAGDTSQFVLSSEVRLISYQTSSNPIPYPCPACTYQHY